MSDATDRLHTSDKRHFTIRACLGRGGFGEVYRASMVNATGLEADVAVKVLHNDTDIDPQAVQRLRDEGRMLGALVHPSIVRVYDLVILEGRVGLVTEYVDGADLSRCIKGRDRMPPRAIAAVIGRVADALNAAWVTPAPGSDKPLQLIHRDVKPANIRIGVEGAVKLLDFGIARSNRVNREANTGTGHMVGSYLYMAPECLTENVFGRESDVYALGATMFESLAGKRLFPAQSLRELWALMLREEEYDAYIETQLASLDVPRTVDRLLHRMLARNPADRPTAADVSAYCDNLVDSMRGPTLRRWCKARDWPDVAVVPGMLDGRVITEATMASSRSFASAAPGVRKQGSWRSTILGLFGGVSVLMMLVLSITAVLLLGALVFLQTQRRGGRLIRPPAAPPIPVVSTGPDLEPIRVEQAVVAEAATRPAPAPTTRYGRVTVEVRPEGSAEVRLTDGRGRKHTRFDRLPYGVYTVWADFGKGFAKQHTVHVDRTAASVTCNAFRRSCE